jgi:hypothetical protein
MFLLVQYDEFEDLREIIDYDPLDISAKDEDYEPPEAPQYIAVKVSDRSLRNIPHGIITSKMWDALTFYVRISTTYIRQFPVSLIVDDLTDSVLDEVIEVIDLKNDCCATFDSHWDCYCKTEDVCGCGCDPLHDGW